LRLESLAVTTNTLLCLTSWFRFFKCSHSSSEMEMHYILCHI